MDSKRRERASRFSAGICWKVEVETWSGFPWGVRSRRSDLCLTHNVGGQIFDFHQRSRGGNARFFHKRRIEHERAAVDEGMMGGFERLAAAARAGVAREYVFINLQIVLKIESVTGIPLLFTRKRQKKFATEKRRIFSGERHRFFACGRAGANLFQQADDGGEQRFALQ